MPVDRMFLASSWDLGDPAEKPAAFSFSDSLIFCVCCDLIMLLSLLFIKWDGEFSVHITETTRVYKYVICQVRSGKIAGLFISDYYES